MKNVPPNLFAELKSQQARIDVGWLIVRADGNRYGFTSSDIPFDYNGDTYSPTNGFNPSAVVSKADLSVDNAEMQVLENDLITDGDLRAGLWDLAQVTIFWICRYHPEWGAVILKTGTLGQIVIKEGQWTTQLRSLLEQLQQPFGYYYTVQCMATLGDARCKVKLNVPTWVANHPYVEGLLTDASIGDIVQPTVPNGFWYVANYTSYAYVGDDYILVTGGEGGVGLGSGASAGDNSLGLGGTIPGSLADDVVTSSGYSDNTTGYGGEPLRAVTQPGQGLSANDDLGPNDNTQVAVGAPFDNLQEFKYDGQPVDIFGIKL